MTRILITEVNVEQRIPNQKDTLTMTAQNPQQPQQHRKQQIFRELQQEHLSQTLLEEIQVARYPLQAL